MRNRSIACSLGLVLLATSAPGLAASDDPARPIAAAAAEKLEAYYVYPSRAREAGDLLRRNAAAGAYDGLREDALAKRVTEDLGGLLHDKHVRLRYSTEVNPPAKPSGTDASAEEVAAQARFDRSVGYGLGRVAHLPGNVGYVDVRYVLGSSREMSTVFDGMANAVAYSEAIVLDLRRDHGGDPNVVARFLSHFLAPKTHLNDFVAR
mgnify:CR=1 FL=1